jgi:hypothetical protein
VRGTPVRGFFLSGPAFGVGGGVSFDLLHGIVVEEPLTAVGTLLEIEVRQDAGLASPDPA